MGCLKLSYHPEELKEEKPDYFCRVYSKNASTPEKCISYYRYGYQGEFAEEDEETGWNSFELRMLDTKIGRWLSADPKREFWSPYVSMGNNPINLFDPDGGSTGEGDTPQMVERKGFESLASSRDFDVAASVQPIDPPEIVDMFLIFTGEQSPGRNRVDGQLIAYTMLSDGRTIKAVSWSANSGSSTLLPLPSGYFNLTNFRNRSENSFSKGGVGFSIDIGPDGVGGRMYLRIHPDGGLPGTAGCIGLTSGVNDLRIFRDMMRNFLTNHGTMLLGVRDTYTPIDPVTIETTAPTQLPAPVQLPELR